MREPGWSRAASRLQALPGVEGVWADRRGRAVRYRVKLAAVPWPSTSTIEDTLEGTIEKISPVEDGMEIDTVWDEDDVAAARFETESGFHSTRVVARYLAETVRHARTRPSKEHRVRVYGPNSGSALAQALADNPDYTSLAVVPAGGGWFTVVLVPKGKSKARDRAQRMTEILYGPRS